jgi:hypothetical protein
MTDMDYLFLDPTLDRIELSVKNQTNMFTNWPIVGLFERMSPDAQKREIARLARWMSDDHYVLKMAATQIIAAHPILAIH